MPYVITGALGESGEIQSLTIGALLPIMNPFSTAPLFVALTEGTDCKKRNRQALLACVYALGILVVFLLLGSAIIDFFRISIPGLRTAGGVIMSAIGFRMLFPGPTTVANTQASQQQLPVRSLAALKEPIYSPSHLPDSTIRWTRGLFPFQQRPREIRTMSSTVATSVTLLSGATRVITPRSRNTKAR